ncbi:MAG: IS1380 family transposase [Prolixibacteraceae bacterium]|nr:IS1380 family transposase [Prolixibacteraceae bacterium]
MKITYSSEKINPFGGINFVNKTLENTGVFQLIDNELGKRPAQAEYTYSDIFRAYWLLNFTGGDCAEDITEHLRPYLADIKGIAVPGADTLLRVQKGLATEKETFTTDKGICHEFNVNEHMNHLMVKQLVHCNQLSPSNMEYTFDYDNQFIPNDKYDSKRSYKHADGYFPGIASINNMPVYFENRNGNSNVKFKQEDTLTRAYNLLKEFCIPVKRSRMDCGSFSKEIVKVVEAHSELFYIRAMRCDDLFSKIQQVKEWLTVEIGFKQYEVASIQYSPFGEDKAYRYVVSREKNTDGQCNLFSGDHYLYRAIMTNDNEKTNLEVVLFYNDRGQSERLFDEMNNDFNWNKLPFSFLHENTVFMIIMAMCRNMYHFLLGYITKKVDFVKKTFRLKKFIFRFVVVPTKWVRQARQDILKVFSTKKYHQVIQ